MATIVEGIHTVRSAKIIMRRRASDVKWKRRRGRVEKVMRYGTRQRAEDGGLKRSGSGWGITSRWENCQTNLIKKFQTFKN